MMKMNLLFRVWMMGMGLLLSPQVLATNVVDFELQSRFENIYTARIKQVYPELKFAIAVDVKALNQVELSLFEATPENPDSYQLDQRIQSVSIYSESELDLSRISELTGLSKEKINFVRLEKSPVQKKEVIPFQEALKEHLGSPEGFVQGIQIASFALILFLGIMAVFVFRNSIRNLMSSMTSALQGIKSGFEEGGFGGSGSQASGSGSDFMGQTTGSAASKTWTDEQLRAMLAECYWTHHDSEASALIRAFPRMETYLKLRFGKEYIEYLKNITPRSLDFMNDAYFLNPQSVYNELSVEDTEIQYLVGVSQFRFEAKNADPSELIKIQQSSDAGLVPESRLSHLRTLGRSIRVQFRTVAEEDSILSNTEILEEVKNGLPSLYCLRLLNSDDFERVISSFSLNKLAEGWIGPEWLLEDLESRMSERKRALFQEIKVRMNAFRSSPVFKDLVFQAKELVKEYPEVAEEPVSEFAPIAEMSQPEPDQESDQEEDHEDAA